MTNYEPYDILLVVAPKDRNKLKYLVQSIDQHMTGFRDIYVVSPTGAALMDDKRIRFFSDQQVLDIDRTRFRYRPSWIYQMYLKLFQEITSCDLFFTIDADVIINRHLPMFNSEGKPILYHGWEQNHSPYFRFQELMLNLPRAYPRTFISDTNFMRRSYIREMLKHHGYSKSSFIEKSFEVICEECVPAEPEIWGQYIAKFHRSEYDFRELKVLMHGKTQSAPDLLAYSDQEIEAQIDLMKDKDCDLWMYHSWLVAQE